MNQNNENMNFTDPIKVPNTMNNLKFSENDLKRIQKNVAILQSQNIPYNEKMKFIPSETNTQLCSNITVLQLLLRRFLIATLATTFPGEVDEQYFDWICRNHYKQFKTDQILSAQDVEILNKIRNNDVSLNKNMLSWLYEECAIYLWVLNLTDFPSQQYQCNVDEMNEMLFIRMGEGKNLPSLLYTKLVNPETKILEVDKLQMRSYSEILEKADLLNRYKWALDEARINNQQLNFPFNPVIVLYQCQALWNVLNWDPNTTIKEVEQVLSEKAINLNEIWEDNIDRLDEAVTDEMIKKLEDKYNLKLPKSYINLMKEHNGGRIKKYCYDSNNLPSYSNPKYEFYEIDNIFGISQEQKDIGIVEYETDVLIDFFKVNEIETDMDLEKIIVFGKNDSGHEYYIFDYRQLNENEEPKIAFCDDEDGKMIILSETFEDFITKLEIDPEFAEDE